jgi:hypothetical protein
MPDERIPNGFYGKTKMTLGLRKTLTRIKGAYQFIAYTMRMEEKKRKTWKNNVKSLHS